MDASQMKALSDDLVEVACEWIKAEALNSHTSLEAVLELMQSAIKTNAKYGGTPVEPTHPEGFVPQLGQRERFKMWFDAEVLAGRLYPPDESVAEVVYRILRGGK